jgi:SNF2 family DNA or RNA helicase
VPLASYKAEINWYSHRSISCGACGSLRRLISKLIDKPSTKIIQLLNILNEFEQGTKHKPWSKPDKTVIFSEFVENLDLIAKELKMAGKQFVMCESAL